MYARSSIRDVVVITTSLWVRLIYPPDGFRNNRTPGVRALKIKTPARKIAVPILARLKMNASPVLDYLAKDDLPGFGAMGPVSMLKTIANSVGRKFIKGHAFGNRLCPERI